MQLHQLKPKHRNQKRKRVGRGGKRGTYSGKGIKGQKSRSGRRLKPLIRTVIKRYPKLRGYRFNTKTVKPAVVNLELLEKKFKAGDKINPEILLEQRLIRKIKGRVASVKILGRGKITKALIIENCQASKGAREQIEKAGGKIS